MALSTYLPAWAQRSGYDWRRSLRPRPNGTSPANAVRTDEGTAGPTGQPMYPSTKHSSLDEAQRRASELAKKILQSHTRLQEILRRHEGTIQRRWAKKNQTQRRNILISTWPEMPKLDSTNGSFALNAMSGKLYAQLTDLASPKLAPILWPHLNLERLEDPKLILLFLKSRGRNPPSTFAYVDADSTRLVRASGVMEDAIVSGATAKMAGSDLESYGKLEASSSSDEREWSGRFTPGDCMATLIVQLQTYKFLVRFAEIVLHDAPEDALTSGDVQPEPEIPLIPGHEQRWKSLLVIRKEAPFRLPATLNIPMLRELVQARFYEAKDHLRGLQEDPEYFSTNVLGNLNIATRQDITERFQLQHLNDSVAHLDDGQFMDMLLAHILRKTYQAVWSWKKMDEHLGRLHVQVGLHRSRLAMSSYPSVAVVEEFLLLEKFIEEVLENRLGAIRSEAIGKVPGFNTEPRPCRPGAPFDYTDHFIRLLALLTTKGVTPQMGNGVLIDQVQYMLEVNNSLRPGVQDSTMVMLGDLALLSEIKTQMNAFEPQASNIRRANPVSDADGEASWGLHSIANIAHSTSFGVWKLLDGKALAYPVHSRRTAATVGQMRKAEEALAALWVPLIEALRGLVSLSKEFECLEDSEPFHRTAPWVERKPALTQTTEGQPAEDIDAQLWEREQRTEQTLGNIKTPQAKQKVKTKGSPTARTAEIPEPSLQVAAARKTTFAVRKNSYRVFKSLFHDPDSSDGQSEVAWKDFLKAMEEIGFGVQKLWGSVWSFSATHVRGISRDIIFHEPHPESKLSHVRARQFGSRLRRAYGWTSEKFSRA